MSPQHKKNWNTKQTKQRKNIKNCKEKDQVNYKGRPIRIAPDLSVETLKYSQELLYRYSINSKRPQMPAQTVEPSKIFNHNRQRKKKDIPQ